MLFQVYGETAMFQWLGWVAVFACLILANEVARRSKAGGIFCFLDTCPSADCFCCQLPSLLPHMIQVWLHTFAWMTWVKKW